MKNFFKGVFVLSLLAPIVYQFSYQLGFDYPNSWGTICLSAMFIVVAIVCGITHRGEMFENGTSTASLWFIFCLTCLVMTCIISFMILLTSITNVNFAISGAWATILAALLAGNLINIFFLTSDIKLGKK